MAFNQFVFVGLAANLPALTAGESGSLAYALDVNAIFQWNGIAWAALGTGGSQSFTSGGTGTVAARVTHVILDGVATTFALTFPVALADKQQLIVMAATAVSVAFSVTGSGDSSTIKTVPATLVAGTGVGWFYNKANNTWYRLF